MTYYQKEAIKYQIASIDDRDYQQELKADVYLKMKAVERPVLECGSGRADEAKTFILQHVDALGHGQISSHSAHQADLDHDIPVVDAGGGHNRSCVLPHGQHSRLAAGPRQLLLLLLQAFHLLLQLRDVLEHP